MHLTSMPWQAHPCAHLLHAGALAPESAECAAYGGTGARVPHPSLHSLPVPLLRCSCSQMHSLSTATNNTVWLPCPHHRCIASAGALRSHALVHVAGWTAKQFWLCPMQCQASLSRHPLSQLAHCRQGAWSSEV